MLKWRAAALTDAGRLRQRNEDSYYVSPDQRVFAVADGMGGAAAGDLASKLAIEAIDQFWNEKPPDKFDQRAIRDWLAEAVALANRAVWHVAKEDATPNRMGTTVVVAVQSDDNHLQIAHVGDSRAYLLREGKPVVLTNDHSVVQEMVRAGRLTEEQARVNPFRNLITRCLGHDPEVEADQTPVEIKSKDWIVLCSDGLPAVLRDEEICAAIETSQEPEPEGVCQELVKRTLDGGAPDNVTVVAIKYLEGDSGNGSK